jgi:Tol biopolymer transport system component
MISNLFCGCSFDDFDDEADLPKNLHNLTNTDVEDDWFPSWSPDGKKIAFITQSGWSDWGISTMDANGKNRRELIEINTFYTPSWSPDGKRIVFSWDNFGHGDYVCIMDADGRNQSNLSYFGGAQSPSWSPDGQSIAFSCYQGTRYNPYPLNDNFDICVMNTDGENLQNLTSTPTCEADPSWSPDGQSIAFSRYQGNWDIYIMDSDGNNQRNLTNSPEDDGEDPSWSPDGMNIAFQANQDISLSYSYHKICVMDKDGRNRRDLVNIADWNACHPSWSPNGKKIAFSFYHYSDDKGYVIQDIYTVDYP